MQVCITKYELLHKWKSVQPSCLDKVVRFSKALYFCLSSTDNMVLRSGHYPTLEIKACFIPTFSLSFINSLDIL